MIPSMVLMLNSIFIYFELDTKCKMVLYITVGACERRVCVWMDKTKKKTFDD